MLPLIAQGFNTKNNLKNSHFQHLNIVEIHFYNKEKSKLYRLKESNLIIDNSDLEVSRLYLLMFTTEFLKFCIKEEEKNQQLYRHIKKYIYELHSLQDISLQFPLKFCLELSKYLGFSPLNNHGNYFSLIDGCFMDSVRDASCTLSELESQLLRKFLNNEGKCNSNDYKVLLHILVRYFKYHIQNFREPKSLQLLEILSD